MGRGTTEPKVSFGSDDDDWDTTKRSDLSRYPTWQRDYGSNQGRDTADETTPLDDDEDPPEEGDPIPRP